jgi:hypothetical protein
VSGNSSVGRAPRCQRGCRGFEPRFPLHKILTGFTCLWQVYRIVRIIVFERRRPHIQLILLILSEFGFWRHSQVAKAAVCKTVIHRFESDCRLQQISKVSPKGWPFCSPHRAFPLNPRVSSFAPGRQISLSPLLPPSPPAGEVYPPSAAP